MYGIIKVCYEVVVKGGIGEKRKAPLKERGLY
jgi:hypothetical protein